VHFFTGPDDSFLDNVKTGPIEVGYNAWIGANVTIGRNVTVGHHSIVAANSLLLRDVPPGHLASGVPAAPVREVWTPDPASADADIPDIEAD
jgi:maltose O-acetyltransferase